MPSLSISSSMRTGFLLPARRRPCTICPGRAPMYVRRWPRISASSRMPPSEMRWNLRPSARAIDLPSEVLPTPGGPTKHRIGSRPPGRIFFTARYSRMRSLIFSTPSWSSSRISRARMRSDRVGGLLAPRHRDQPVDVGAGHRVLRRGRRHLGETVELAEGFLLRLLGHPGRLDLLPQRLDLLRAIVAVAELLLDRLHLLAQVVLALRLRHLGLDLGLDLRAELEDLGLLGQRPRQLLQAVADVDRLQQLLLELVGRASAAWRR